MCPAKKLSHFIALDRPLVFLGLSTFRTVLPTTAMFNSIKSFFGMATKKKSGSKSKARKSTKRKSSTSAKAGMISKKTVILSVAAGAALTSWSLLRRRFIDAHFGQFDRTTGVGDGQPDAVGFDGREA